MPPPVLLAAGILSVQVGAGLAGRMFGQVSPAGLTGVRLWAASLLLAGLGGRQACRIVRGLVAGRAWRDAALLAGFGIALGIMNFSIYQAFARIPLGIAVTIEFLGPLGVAVASSRRLIDLLWVVLAGTGVTLLGTAGVGAAELGHFAGLALRASSTTQADAHGSAVPAGVTFALISALSWAIYILLSARTGRRFAGSSGLVLAMGVAAIAVTPIAVASAGRSLLRPAVLTAGLAIGLLSSVIPYRFELEALRRIPARVFGIWMSLEPAVAALVGVVMLGQALSVAQWLAIGCVIVASAGAAGRAATAPKARRRLSQGGASGKAAAVPARTSASYDSSVSAPVPASARAASPRSRPERARRWPDLLLNPSPPAMSRIALAGVIASAVIIPTGAAVRLSQSGLGCTTWPKCTASSLIASGASGEPLIHRWIEFSNRVVTALILVIAIAVFVAAWRFKEGGRRRDLVWLASAQPAGIVAQAVIGGIVVRTGLSPFWVSLHYLATLPVLAAAVALHARCGEGTAPPRPLVVPLVRLASRLLLVVASGMMVAGTLVTGTGPLAGAGSVPRYHFLSLTAVTQLHADIGWVLGTVAVMLALTAHLTQAPARVVRLSLIVVGLIGVQGAIGYAQYFAGLPAGLVWVHVASTALIWIAVIELNFALRDRGKEGAPAGEAGLPVHGSRAVPSRRE